LQKELILKTLVDCDCEARVHPDGSGVEIDYCSAHEAAPDLLAALRDCADYLEVTVEALAASGGEADDSAPLLAAARAAIAKAGRRR
jgi:hypothetical protein